MDAREEISRWLALLVQLSSEAESDQIDKDVRMLMGVTLQLTSQLAKRNKYLAKQCRPRKPTISQKAPQKGPQKEKNADSSADTPKFQNDAEDRSQTKSRIMQGAYKADPSLADQQRALRGYVYGAQNDEVAFRKAAQAIAR